MSGAATLSIAFRSLWLSGTGGGGGPAADTRAARDDDGFPALPMSQVKGTVRETARALAQAGAAGWDIATVDRLFGAEGQVEAALAFCGEARLSAASRAALAGRQRALFRRIPSTMVEASGAARDRSLRTIEAAVPVALEATIVWRSADAPGVDWVALLAAAFAATPAFGKGKTNGYGVAVATLRADAPGAGPGAPPPVPTRRLRLVLTQTRAAVFSQRSASEGAHRTMAAPPGSAVLGWLAGGGRYLGFTDPVAVFHSGAVRFGPVLPLTADGAAAIPLPKTLVSPKAWRPDAATEALAAPDGRTVADLQAAGESFAALVAAGEVRVHPPSTGTYETMKLPDHVTPDGRAIPVRRGGRLRTATSEGRAARAQLFGYQHLTPRGAPRFEALIEADASVPAPDWEALVAAFHGATLDLGRARGTGYGGCYACEIFPDPAQHPWEAPLAAPSPGDLVTVLALSDLAVTDAHGAPTDRPTWAQLGLPGAATLVEARSATTTRRWAPWNAALGRRDTERLVIEAGSVLAFRVTTPWAAGGVAALVGEGREAGLGRVWVAPPFLAVAAEGDAPIWDARAGAPSISTLASPLPSAPTPPAPPVAEVLKPELDAILAAARGAAAAARGAPAVVSGAAVHRLHLTFAAMSPIAVGDGGGVVNTRKGRDGTDETFTVATLMRDWNDLPAIPGASWRGVIRHLVGEEQAAEWFGIENPDGEGWAGAVRCGWALAHDAADHCTPGFRAGTDEILDLLRRPEPMLRDHVALDDRHVVDGRRKFARAAVPVGTRFSLWMEAAEAGVLLEVARRFRHPRFRLGRAATRGYGRIAVVRASLAAFGPDQTAALATARATPPSRPLARDVTNDLAPPADTTTRLVIAFTPEALLRIGGATEASAPLLVGTKGARRVADGAPWNPPGTQNYATIGGPEEGRHNALTILREPVIAWTDDQGRIDAGLRFPAPGSALIGPLAHRTLFHWNKANGRVIDAAAPPGPADLAAWRARPEPLGDFFGAPKAPTAGDDDPAGLASRVLIEDAAVEDAAWIVNIDHVAIDRWLGGARSIEGMLFREELLLRGTIRFQITLRPPFGAASDGPEGWPQATAEAFLRAVRDLCRGRLAIGAKSHGVGTGVVGWQGAGAPAWSALAAAITPQVGGPGG